MSASAPNLDELPTETLEQVLLYLPGQDIIKMEAVNRHFWDLIHNSPVLQHRRELFAAGLIDNPYNPCDLAQRRKLREGYTHKWSKTASVVKSTHKLPPNQSSHWRRAKHHGGNVLASHPTPGRGLDFMYIPPAASQKLIDVWSISPFSFKLFAFAVYPPENVLAVSEHDERLLRIHLLNLRDGSPYCAPPSNTITWAIPQGVPQITGGTLAITGSRVMIYLSHSTATRSNRGLWAVLVWDRKTGDLVLDPPTMIWRGFCDPAAIFLDEFRIVVTTRDTRTNALKFTVFNTLIPQDHPTSSRRFSLPQQYQDREPHVFVDRDRPLGTLNSDAPLITDPTQAILVVKLSKLGHRRVFLVVRINALIDHACSTRADAHLPWDEWGRDVVITEDQPSGSNSLVYVHGTHLVLLSTEPHRSGLMAYYRVRTFDFGRRGCGALPFWDEEGGGAERKALIFDGSEFVFETVGVRNMRMLRSVGSPGNGNFFRISADDRDMDAVVDVWELV